MSIEAMNWAKKQRCGSPSVKAVLVEIANWANPDGRAEFRLVRDIARDVEMSERNVQRIIKKLETSRAEGGLGLLQRVPVFGESGVQRANGFLLVGLTGRVTTCRPSSKSAPKGEGDKLSAPRVTDCHREGDTGVTGEGDAGVTQYKDLNREQDITPLTPRRGKERVRSSEIPIDWQVPAINALPSEISGLARQWPAGAYGAEGIAFHQHWRGRGTAKADWAALWAARVQARHEAVMRAAKAGVTYAVPETGFRGAPADVERPPVVAKRREGERSADLHAVLAERLGMRTHGQWFAPAALILEDDVLTVVAPSAFHAAQLEAQHGPAVTAALDALGIGVAAVRYTAEKTMKKGGARRG
jgi:hypothetical protein